MGVRVGVGLAVLLVLLLVVADRSVPHPRTAVEPLPEGLSIAGAHDVAQRRIEGPGLCLVVTGAQGESAHSTLQRLEAHLVEAKGWSPRERGQFVDWASVSLTQRGPRGLVAGPVREFLRLAVSGHECRALEAAMNETPDGVLVSIWLWER